MHDQDTDTQQPHDIKITTHTVTVSVIIPDAPGAVWYVPL